MKLKRIVAHVSQSAMAWNLISTGLRVGAGVVVLPIMLHVLPSAELGLWYLFVSVAGLAFLLDIGFNTTMTRAAGYVWAGASQIMPMGIHFEETEERKTSTKPNHELLGRLVATMGAYYRCLALFVLVLMLGGVTWWIWHKTGNLDHRASLRWAWIFFSLSTSYNVVTTFWPSMLLGINGVRQVQQITLVSSLVNYGLTAVLLELHCGIWAMVIGRFLGAFILRQGAKMCFVKLAGPSFHAKASWDPQLLKTMWPMAWRQSLVCVGSFLIFNVNTVICSAYLDLAVTGSYGLTLQLINLLVSVSSAWLDLKMPLINQLRAQHRLFEVTNLFIKSIRRSLLTYLAGASILLVCGHWLLLLIHAHTGLIPAPLLAVLLLFYFLETQHCGYSNLVLSENFNPFMVQALVSGTAIVLLSILLTPHLGLWGLVLSFGGVQLCYNNWWPVLRALRGLKIKSADYWKLFFTVPRWSSL